MHHELLGFDIRLCPGAYVEARWDQDSRMNFLLRPTIEWPLSVDDCVWPSVFEVFWSSVSVQEQSLVRSPGDPDFPIDPRQSLELWSDLEAMKTFFLTQRKVQTHHGVQIAVELIARESVRSDDYWRAVLEPYDVLAPSKIPLEWLFLGYDVADQYQLSGLTNCEYDDHERAILQASWSPRLNEHGLFQTLDEAMSFRDITDQRVPDHAPFYVYGLFRDPLGCDIGHL